MSNNPITSRLDRLYKHDSLLGGRIYALYQGTELNYYQALSRSVKLCRDLMNDQNFLRYSPQYLQYNCKFLSHGGDDQSAFHSKVSTFQDGAVLDNHFKRNVESIVSSVINGKLKVQVDNEQIMDALSSSARGFNDYKKFLTEVLREVMITGSCLIFIDQEDVTNFRGVTERKIQLKYYKIENVDSIRMDNYGNIVEAVVKTVNNDNETRYWYFFSDPQRGLRFRIYVLNETKEDIQATFQYEDNENLIFPPLFLVGIEGILTQPANPYPPLIDIAHLTIAIYQESAKRNYANIPLLISRMYFSGMDVEEVRESLNQTNGLAIVTGSTEAKAQILESRNNYSEAFNENIELYQNMAEKYIFGNQASARLERETAEGVRSRDNQKNTLVCNLAATAKDTMERVIHLIALMLDIDIDSLDIRIDIGKELGNLPIQKDFVPYFYNQTMNKTFPIEFMANILRESNLLPRDIEAEEIIELLSEALENSQPMMPPQPMNPIIAQPEPETEEI